MKRMWINQPSTLQQYHAMHGTRVLAEHEYGDTYRIWFLDGPIESQQLPGRALLIGWPKERRSRGHGRGVGLI